MNKIGTGQRKSDLGEYTVSIYRAKNCNGCPMRGQCHNAKYNRTIEINHNLNRLRNIAKQKLLSERGLYHRSKRPIEPEAVFGRIKFNNKFKRLTLKGLEKVEIEFGLIAVSHNLRKITKIMSNLTDNPDFLFNFSIFMENIAQKVWDKFFQIKIENEIKFAA